MRRTALAGAGLIVLAFVTGALLWQRHEPASAETPGDADCDGEVTAVDAAIVLQVTAGIVPSVPCAAKADTNGDGEISAVDGAIILQYVAGLIDHIGPEASPTATRTRTPSPTPAQAATATAPPTATATLPPTPAATATATATPANTATATPSRTPTSTPTATATPAPAVIARHSSWYVDTEPGYLWVVGEVYNGLGHDIANAALSVDLYSASDQLLASDQGSSFACLVTIPSHSDGPFDILVFEPPEGVDHVVVHVTGYTDLPDPDYDPPPVGLDLSQQLDSYRDDDDFWHVAGEIFNHSHTGQSYDFIQPCVALYNAQGDVIRVDDFAFIDSPFLEPGETTLFESEINALGILVADRRVWIQASYAPK